MYKRNLYTYLRNGAIIVGVVSAVVILSNNPAVNTLEQKLNQYSGMLESRVKSPETKKDFYNRMKKEGWEFLTNYNPKSYYDEKTGLYLEGISKPWFKIADELNIPRDGIRVEQQAYDGNRLIEHQVSIWIRAKKRQ